MLRNNLDAPEQDWSHYAIQLDSYRKKIDDALTQQDYKLARKLWHEENEISFEFIKHFCEMIWTKWTTRRIAK